MRNIQEKSQGLRPHRHSLDVSLQEEIFFIAEALVNGRPRRDICYNTEGQFVEYGDLWLASFGDRAVKAGLRLTRSRGRYGDYNYMHDGGVLYERYKRWYRNQYTD